MKMIATLLLFVCSAFAGVYHPAIDYIFPMPESKLHSPHTTVILKIDKDKFDQISDLSGLIRVERAGDDIAGSTFWAGDDRTIIFKPDSPLNANEKIDIVIQTSQLGSDDFSFSFYTAARSDNHLPEIGKNVAIQSAPLAKNASVRLINDVAVPGDFPPVRARQYGETAPGRVFWATTHPNDRYGNYVAIVENDGTPYFYRRYPSIPRTGNFTAHPTGVLTIHCYETFHIVLDQHFVEIDTIHAGHGYFADDHELQILENGHILQVVRDHVKVDMSEVVSGGKTNATVEAHHFQEMDADQNVIFEWRNWDHLDIRDTYVSLTKSFIDFVHLNSIAIDYDGHFVVSLREYKAAAKIHRTTGEIIWQLGGRNSDFEFVNEPTPFSFQHDVRPVPGKPNHYTLFDNGRGRQPQYSRGVEYKLDLNTMTAEKVWEYRHDPDWYSGWMGSVQRLLNGNTLLDFPGGAVRVVEVTPDNEPAWELTVSGIETYRSRRYEWEGEMQAPFLELENLGNAVRLIFNKFGDEDVAQYNVYTGRSADALELFGSTSETFMEIDAGELGGGAQQFFRVTAVDGAGNESGFSKVAETFVREIAPGENAVYNGTFETDAGWNLTTTNGARASGQAENGSYIVEIQQAGSQLTDVRLQQENILVLQNKKYVFEFDAKSTTSRAVSAKIISGDSRETDYGRIGSTAISTRLRHYSHEFGMRHPTDMNARVVFDVGGTDGTVEISNVSLTYKQDESTLTPLASPWQSRDIGAPGVAGEAGMLQNRFVIRGSGADIWGGQDAFHFVYQPVSGDVDIRARVVSQEDSDPWAKTGVMLRNSLAADSRHAMMIVAPENGAAFQRRVQDGGGSTHSPGGSAQPPHWVRLLRKGDRISGYTSEDGENWSLVDSETIKMADDIYAGLPVTSHNDAILCEAQLDNVELLGDSMRTQDPARLPQQYRLYAAYPNPFNPETTIRYDLPHDSHVLIEIYDLRGRHVRTLVDAPRHAGSHLAAWDGLNAAGLPVSSGLYFFRMQSGDYVFVQKVTLVR